MPSYIQYLALYHISIQPYKRKYSTVSTPISTPASKHTTSFFIYNSLSLSGPFRLLLFRTQKYSFRSPNLLLFFPLHHRFNWFSRPNMPPVDSAESWNVRWTRTLPAFQRKDLEEFTMTSTSPAHEIFHATPVLSQYQPTYFYT